MDSPVGRSSFNSWDCEGRVSLTAGLREFRREVETAGSPRPLGRGMKAESFAHITFALHSNYIRRDRGIICQR